MIIVKSYAPSGDPITEKIKGNKFLINGFGHAEIFDDSGMVGVAAGFFTVTKEEDNA